MELSSSNIIKNYYIFSREIFSYVSGKRNPKKLSYILGNRNSPQIVYIFSREILSYILGKQNPEKILYILSNGTFLYFKWLFAKPENQKFLILFLN